MQRSLLLLAIAGTSWANMSCKRQQAASPEPPAIPRVTSGRLDVAVTSDGFVPAVARVPVGQPLTLTVTRKVARTCATEIVIKDYGVNEPLPENQPVEITLKPLRPGEIHFACAMNMIAGTLIAE